MRMLTNWKQTASMLETISVLERGCVVPFVSCVNQCHQNSIDVTPHPPTPLPIPVPPFQTFLFVARSMCLSSVENATVTKAFKINTGLIWGQSALGVSTGVLFLSNLLFLF